MVSESEIGCVYPIEYYNCFNVCLNDLDDDDVCDELEVFGCTDENACNYNHEATMDDGNCLYGCECTPQTIDNFTHLGTFNGSEYYLSQIDDNINWSEANQICNDQNGHLVTITTLEERNFLAWMCLAFYISSSFHDLTTI